MLLFRLQAFCLSSLLVLGILGCGAEQYESRLKQSRDYYNYLEQIEQNLGPKWSDGRVVEMFRAPKQFVQIPAPVPIKNDEGKDEMPAVDPRQPDYMNLVFPHGSLIGAWEAPFSVVTADGSADTRKGYIYILSNYWGFLGEDPAEALKFTPAILQHIGDALEDRIPQEKIESPATELYPKAGGYLPASSYTIYDFHPKAITLRAAERESTINYTFKIYGKQNGNIQAMVLMVLPDNISSQEKLVDRARMMLELFRITKTEPKPGNQGGGAAPVQGQPAF